MTATWEPSESLPEPSIAEFELLKRTLHALTLILVGQEPRAKLAEDEHKTEGSDDTQRRRRTR